MIWDGLDRQARWIFPSKSTPGVADAPSPTNPGDYEEYGYDPNGNRTSLRKRDGSVLAYQYDALNRVSAKIVPERSGLTAAQTRDVHYLYDNRGLRTKARFDGLDGEGITTYYDGFGRPVTTLLIMGGFERYLWHYYDPDGNVTRLTHPDGAAFAFTYDGLGRMTTMLDRAYLAHVDDYVIRYFHNAQGGRYAAVRGADPAGFAAFHYYDPVQRPWVTVNDLPVAGGDMSVTLAYNPAGQIRQLERSNDAYAWTGANGVDRSYAVNGLNQYTSVGPATFGYDLNGNLTSDGSTSFVYDVENRLVSASGAKSAALVYDPLGRLFQTSGGAAGVTQFLYDGDKLIAEYNGAGTLLKRYLHGPRTDEPVAVYEGAALGIASRRYMLPDERGSIAALVNADGSPSAINTYDEYGIPGTGNQGRFQYTGQAWLPELGLYYYKARFYSTRLGRFLQVDPIGYADQMNLYAYVGNDPVNKVDPTGLYEINCGRNRTCNEAASRFEAARQANLGSRHADVVAAAQAWGAPGEANGVSVNFLSDKEMNDKYKSTTAGAIGELNFQGKKVSMVADIRSSITGKALRGTVAHEGTHVVRITTLAQSYNATTGKYSASANITGRQMEIQAWTVQNKISNQFSSSSAIQKYVAESYSKKALNANIIGQEFTE